MEKYVKNGLESGRMIPKYAEKCARVIARQGYLGEKVVSWIVDTQGNAVQEKVN